MRRPQTSTRYRAGDPAGAGEFASIPQWLSPIRLSTIVEADTILVLHRGQAVERGNHQQLLAAKAPLLVMYQLQLAGEELAASAREESLSA